MTGISAAVSIASHRWSPPRRADEGHAADFPHRGDYRRTLVQGAIATVEDSSVSPHRPPPSGHTEHHQIVLPYLGLFEFRVGTATALLDANRILYVTGGQDFADRHPLRNVGHASVIITPSQAVIDELCGRGGVSQNCAFRASTRPATARSLLLTQRLLALRATNDNPLEGEEVALAALRETISAAPHKPAPARIVDKAKQVLHAKGCHPITLEEVAREVGVSAVYLTQEFTRSEGIPLYRYQTRLRLSRALVELPDCDNITGLALDLGFSSHSHFSAAFKSMFGLTPSQFRHRKTGNPDPRI
jgi:AraC-like DNA-binding protein